MFFEWLRGVWGLVYKSRPKSPRQILIVEVEKGVPIKAADDAAVATLKDHPGFVALVNRMKLRRAYLSAQLNGQRQESIRDVDFLQHGIYWLGFIESEVNAATNSLKAKAVPIVASDTVLEEFNKVRSAIEAVGNNEDL